jgi:tyrosinase
MRTVEDFFSAAAYCRDRLNPTLFVYAFSVAILHRPDTRNISLPPFSEIFPDKFVDRAVFDQAREQTNIIVEEGARVSL